MTTHLRASGNRRAGAVQALRLLLAVTAVVCATVAGSTVGAIVLSGGLPTLR